MTYTKPAMRKVLLRSDRAVSDTCWAYSANGGADAPVYYYEFSNTGWLKDEAHPNGYGVGTWIGFQVKGDVSCKEVKNITYFVRSYGDAIVENGLQAQADAALAAHLTEIGALGGNGGSPFKAESSGFSTTVGKSW